MKLVKYTLNCRPLGETDGTIVVDDSCTREEAIKLILDENDTYVWINHEDHISCDTCIHSDVCGLTDKANGKGCKKYVSW